MTIDRGGELLIEDGDEGEHEENLSRTAHIGADIFVWQRRLGQTGRVHMLGRLFSKLIVRLSLAGVVALGHKETAEMSTCELNSRPDA